MVYGDAEAMRWVGDGNPISQAECEAWLTVTENNYRKRGYGMFAIEDRASGQVIGFCGLVHPGDQQDAEVKYAFLRAYWGRGLATETVRALLLYGATHHALTRVIATVAPENKASQRVLLKAGMVKTELRHNEDDPYTHVFEWLAR